MAQLTTVQDYLDESRRLLLDQNSAAYRYPTVDLVDALNLALMEMRRLRPDLFLRDFTVPAYSSTALTATVDVNIMYRMPVVYYIIGHSQLRDDEPTVDQRAGTFLIKFTQQLTGMA
jgi:hypothetical protein